MERNHKDEQRHLAWIREAIAGKLWEIKEGRATVEGEEKGKKRNAA